MKRCTDGRKRCINLMSPKYSVIVAENRGFSSRNGIFFAIFCQALLYRTRFQASSGNSDSSNWPGYEAGFNRRFGNVAFFSLRKFKYLRVSGKTNLSKCSGFFMEMVVLHGFMVVLEISTTYRLVRLTNLTISIQVPCDGVFVVIGFLTMYNKTIVRFSFSDILNNQVLGKCYQPRPSAQLITRTSTLSILILLFLLCF